MDKVELDKVRYSLIQFQKKEKSKMYYLTKLNKVGLDNRIEDLIRNGEIERWIKILEENIKEGERLIGENKRFAREKIEIIRKEMEKLQSRIEWDRRVLEILREKTNEQENQ